MTDPVAEPAPPPAEQAPPVVVLRRARWPRWLVQGLAAIAILLGGLYLIVDSDLGHRFVADRVAALRPANGLRVTMGRIDGSLFGKARISDLRIYDPQGLVLEVPRADLDWRPLEWMRNRLDIRSLVAPRATLWKLPRLTPTGRKGPILPGFDIHVGTLRIDRLTVATPVTGTERHGQLIATADIRSGRARVELAAMVAGSDRLRLHLDAEPDRDRFELRLAARGERGGVLSKWTGLDREIAARIAGDGRWSAWRGSGALDIGGVRITDLALGNHAGRYSLRGFVAPETITRGKLQRLTRPRVTIAGQATLADRLLDGTLSLRSAALAVDARGGLDLAASAYRRVAVRARLLRPDALFPDMTGRNVVLDLDLDGAFDRGAFDYQLRADRFAFGKTGFERPLATGAGRLSGSPALVPVRFTAAQVTGVGTVAGGILRNLRLEGVLHVTGREIIGNRLRFRSDQLDGTAMLQVDLRNGTYSVGLVGGLQRYLIPGLGIVEVRTDLRVVPGAGGHGMSVAGTGDARMLRLDNAFFRSLTGGLPRLSSRLQRGPDGILHLSGLVLTSPLLRLAGNGYRRRDGTFHFEGGGTHRTYGPVRLVLDGRIEKPTLDLQFDRPNKALGLSAVKAHLDPDDAGYAFTAAGGSRLGPFEAAGAILLPRGGTARIAFDRIDVSGTRATGGLDIVPGGFDGRLSLAGGGLSGDVLFAPAGTAQRIEAHLTAANAQLQGFASVARGRLNLTMLLDPAGTTIDATATAEGMRRGALSIARLAGRAQLRDGEGEVRASLAGSRGRGFAIQTVTQIGPDFYSVQASGTVDRRDIRLVTPAVLRREGDGWRLAPTEVAFAGGSARVGGLFAPRATSLDASLTAMPLSVLDMGFPGLGLGGSASGSVTYSAGSGTPPTGRIDMKVRGLTRSGLVLTSRPIDLGLAGVLSADKAALRAVMASGGKTIGRAQARLSPLSGGDIVTRLTTAPIFAQLRYAGPADTLWRLTGIELFDLTGPVAIGADLGGTIDHPVIRGSVRTDGARIESATTGTTLANVQATGRFGGSRLVIDRFQASDGGSGSVTGTGAFDFAAANGVGIALDLRADHAQMIKRDDIGATLTGPLTIRSDGAGGTIGGDVVLNASRYRLGRATTAAPVPKLKIEEVNRPLGSMVDAAPGAPWKLDVTASAPDNLRVTGLGLSSEWSAKLRIRGEPTNPSITGQADLVRGDYEFAGREFQLDRGILRFDGSVPANPSLDIVANANTQGLNATIRVSGTSEKPEINFTSIPALPEDELLSRLLFGTSITNLSAPEALQLASAVAALQSGGTGLDPINAVRRAAGLDRLRILPPDAQTGQGTAIAAGKYVTRRTYVEIITDGQGYSATRLEFQVTRWLSLLATLSTVGRQSANVRVSKDY